MKQPTPDLLRRRRALGRRIREIRKARALSQEELANLSGLDRSYAGAVERGERNLGIDNLNRIADALEVSPREFF